MAEGRARWLEAAAVAGLLAALFVAMLRAREDVGLPIDEAYYHFAGASYAEWIFEARRDTPEARSARRDEVWSQLHEHPPLGILSYGLASRWVGDRLGRLGAARAVSITLFAALALGLYHFARRAWGPIAAAGAALALVASPRLVGHGLIAALDLPTAVTCFAAGMAYLRASESRRRALWFGLVLGIAYATKLNAFLLPLAFLVWGEIFRPRQSQQAYAAMFVMPWLVLIAVWPWLWKDPLQRIVDYLSFHFHKTKWPTWYFGVRYQDPEAPWHYPLVFTAITLPVPVLLLIVAGLARLLHRRFRDELGSLALLAALVPILAVARPGQSKYDCERTFLSAFPYLFLLAGWGFEGIVGLLHLRLPAAGIRLPRGAVALALALALFAAPIAGVIRQHPYQLNYYSGLVGGMAGALRAGLETSSWGAHTAGREVREWANEHLPAGATIATNAGSYGTLHYYREVGLLRGDIRFEKDARYWFLEVCQAYAAGPWWWELYDDRAPSWKRIKSFVKDGVPMFNVFERRTPALPAPPPVPAPVPMPSPSP